MPMYEATAPISLIANETVASGLRGRLAVITPGAGGRVARAGGDTDIPVAGVFAQDSMVQGEPVTVDQLQGKVTMIAKLAITAGWPVNVHNATTNADRGKVTATAEWHATSTNVGIALEDAAADGDRIQVLAAPWGNLG